MKKVKKLSELSVFFPAHNEEENIVPLIKQTLKVLPSLVKKFEIIIVNDGSTDRTGKLGRELSRKHRVVYSYNHKNLGYGGALKKGFSKTKYRWVFYTDSDLQFDITELKKFIALTADYQLILGYRKNRAEGARRTMLANALKVWNAILLGFPRDIKDIDCAFKLIHRDVLQLVQPLTSDGAMISTELLLKAHLSHIPYIQVGVKHYPRKSGTPSGSNWLVIARAVRDTFHLQWQHIFKPKLLNFKLYAK